MKKFLPFFLFVLFASAITTTMAQSSSNYAFTTAADASLALDKNANAVDMSTGTTQLVAASTDDGASAVTNIGFTFRFMGSKFTQFSATSNGLVQLGSVAATGAGSSSNLVPYQLEGATAASPKIAAFAADLYVSSSGKVHYKLVGTAPNRCLVIEFLNMALGYSTTAVDGTYQVRLYETSGIIEFVYGAMNRNTGTAAYTYEFSIGFSAGSGANNGATVTTSTHTADYGATLNRNTYASGTITDLNSTTNGSRRYYRFTPPAPAAASNLSFTGVTTTGMTLNWIDNSTNEVGFEIFRSGDGGANYTLLAQTPANATTYVATGLLASTSYTWQVVPYSEGVSGSALTGSQSTLAPTEFTTNGTGGGLWSAPSTWAGGVVPGATNAVTIKNGDNVTIDIAANAYSLVVGQGTSGSLQFEAAAARSLTVAGNVTIAAGASITTAATGTVTGHQLTIGGNLTNNGTLNLSTNSNTAGADLNFNTEQNSNFTGTGSNNLWSLSLSKGSRTPVIDINVSNFTVRGLSTGSTAPLLTSNVGTGTVKFSGTNTFDGVLWSAAAYTIPATMGFWLNNPNFTVNAQTGSATVAGLFRVSQGTFNIGTAADNSMSFSASSVITVDGGTINAAGRFGVGVAANVFSYTQSGGNITVNMVGNTSTTLASFDLGTSSASTVLISGGTIVVQLAGTGASGPRDYRNQAGSGITGVTGGTVQFGNANSGAAKAFIVAGVFPNFVITNTSGNHTATFQTPVTYNNVTLNITINNGNTVNFGNFVFLFSGDAIVNNGTLTHTGASSRFITFKPNTNITYSGSGTVTAPMTSLELQNDLNFTFNPAVSPVVTARIIIFSGSFVNANKITLGNGGTTTGTIQIGNTTTPTQGGTFDVAPTFNLGSSGQVISYLRTTIPIVAGPEINPTRVLTNMTIDPDVTPMSITGGDLQVTGTLTLTSGNANLNGSTLTLGTGATSRGTLSFTTATGTILYNGKMKKWFTNATNTGVTGDFPMGIATARRVARILFTGAPTTGGSLTTEWVSTPPGTTGLPLTEGAINVTKISPDGFWRITAGDGLTGGTYSGTFTAANIVGITDPTQIVLLKRAETPGSPWTLDGTHVATTGTSASMVISRTGMNGFSEFGIGSGAVNPLPIKLTSIKAYQQDRGVQVEWKVSTEVNVTGYMVERSVDGRMFFTAGEVAARNAGTYHWYDASPAQGDNFYRVKVVDHDGSVSYTPVVRVTLGKGKEFITTYPNPVQGESFNLSLNNMEKGTYTIIVTTLSGQRVYSEVFAHAGGSATRSVMLSNGLASGTYILQVLGADKPFTQKIVKE